MLDKESMTECDCNEKIYEQYGVHKQDNIIVCNYCEGKVEE
jgi:hypothetical protein